MFLSSLDQFRHVWGRTLLASKTCVEYLDGIARDTLAAFWPIRIRAQLLFEKLLGYANHLGLYSEELGGNGRHLGNFPQAFTHLALISAATYLDRALSGTNNTTWR